MKKFLSVIISILMVACFIQPFSATAEEQKCDTQIKVEKQINGAGNYLAELYTSFTVENAKDLLMLINAGLDMSSYKDSFVSSVKDCLDAGAGKIVSESEEWYQDEDGNWLSTVTSVESPAVYGAVILVLDDLGIDYTDFYGYDIAEAFSAVDVDSNSDNPYNYYLAVQGALNIGDYELANALCDDMIAKYYVDGKGLDYYGFSCDNTAMLAYTLAACADDYYDIIEDCLDVLEGYRKDGGYYGSDDYTPDANCDSTALMLAVYSALEDEDMAREVYALLCNFELEGKDGIFDYTSNEEANIFATKDALFALKEFDKLLYPCFDGHNYGEDEEVCVICGEYNPEFAETMEPTDIAIVDGEYDIDKGIVTVDSANEEGPNKDSGTVSSSAQTTSPDTGNHFEGVALIAILLGAFGCCFACKKNNVFE